MQHEQLPWTWALRLGSAVPTLRTRTVIMARDASGILHQAELAPCPGVHLEDHSAALKEWQRDVEPLLLQRPLPWEQWNWTQPAFGLLDLPPTLSRSVLATAEQLLLSAGQLQNPEPFSLPAPVAMQGSALLALQNEDASQVEFQELWTAGFRVFKCKVGRGPAPQEYKILSRMVQSAKGQLQLRLDANRGMSAADRAFWMEHAATLPLVYWEEAGGLQPLAWDETLWDAASIPSGAVAWVLKPTRLGLSRTVDLMKKAALQGIPCVLSNAFDSGLTLRCTAWLYAAFCADPQALGFGTTRFLPPDAWGSERWGAAHVTVPSQPFALRGT